MSHHGHLAIAGIVTYLPIIKRSKERNMYVLLTSKVYVDEKKYKDE